jgi:plastocyanin
LSGGDLGNFHNLLKGHVAVAEHKKIAVLSAVLVLVVSLARFAQAGDVQGKVTAQGMRSPEDIVVYIDSIPGKTFPPQVLHAVMDQVRMEFVPHVRVILKGTSVNFLNDDPVQHNVYWPAIDDDRNLAHNMGTWPQGIVKSFAFGKLGVVPLLCKVHSEMSGYIVVVSTPYFAMTDKEGNYTINNVSPGRYALKTWSEEAKPATQAVTVQADLGARAKSGCKLRPMRLCYAADNERGLDSEAIKVERWRFRVDAIGKVVNLSGLKFNCKGKNARSICRSCVRYAVPSPWSRHVI